MKTKLSTGASKRRSECGSVLAVTLMTTAILGITLWSYLLMLQNQNLSVVRSQAWNSSLALAEAGAEEALAQLNPGATVAVNLNANGWGPPYGGAYGPMTRTNTAGTYSVSYTTNAFPIIISAGSAKLPYMSATLSRIIRVTTTNVPLFNVAFASVGSITMNGNGVGANSYDSSNPSLSTNGQYDSLLTTSNANVASVNGPVNLGNHTIDGNLYLGPNATLGSGTNNVSGTVYDDFNVNYPDVVLPSVIWTSAGVTTNQPGGAATVNGTTFNHAFFSSGNYSVADSGSIYVAPGVSVTLNVTAASWSPGGLTIDTSTNFGSGNLTVYMSGTSMSLGSSSPNVNSGVPGNFIYYGLPSNTSISFSGNSSFIGCVYAPEASVTLSGGGSNNGFIGSLIANTITMNGHYDFHYDMALAKSGPTRGFTPVSWQEL